MIDKILAKTFSSKIGQRAIKAVTHPSRETLLNNTLPLLESVVCGGSYIYATATNKNIPSEQKPILQWQNILNTALGIAISGTLNRWVSKKGNDIIQHLDPKNMKKFSRVCDGIKVGLPILVTSVVMRWGISTLTVPMSDLAKKLHNLFDKKKDGQKKVDVLA